MNWTPRWRCGASRSRRASRDGDCSQPLHTKASPVSDCKRAARLTTSEIGGWLRDTHGEGPSVIFNNELQASFRSLGHLARCRYVVEIGHSSYHCYAAWTSDQTTNVCLVVRCTWLPFVQHRVKSGFNLAGGEAIAGIIRLMIRCWLLRFLSRGYVWLKERLDGCYLRCHLQGLNDLI